MFQIYLIIYCYAMLLGSGVDTNHCGGQGYLQRGAPWDFSPPGLSFPPG